MYKCIWMIECLSALCDLNGTNAMDAGPYEVVSICSLCPVEFLACVSSLSPASHSVPRRASHAMQRYTPILCRPPRTCS
jgi:hypothetical protein